MTKDLVESALVVIKQLLGLVVHRTDVGHKVCGCKNGRISAPDDLWRTR